MSETVALWVRALLALNRGLSAGARALMIGRDELLCAAVTPADRDRVTSWMYAKQTAFLPGGPDFNAGLHGWEERVITGPLFPRRGRILIGAAGGGRELVPLAERGYDVVAFEPSPPLFAGATSAAARFPNAHVIQASYRDLVQAAEQGSGPLAAATSEAFDAVFLGWGSLSHVTVDSERIALLRAVRHVAPKAPVVLSFFRPDARVGRIERLRRPVRWLLRPLGAVVDSHLRFSPTFGFVFPLNLEQVQALAASTGYHVLTAESVQWGNAVFLPRTTVNPAT